MAESWRPGQLQPQLAINLLRAKAGQLEEATLRQLEAHLLEAQPIDELETDLALLASLLADQLEQLWSTLEQLAGRVADLEDEPEP